MKRQVFSLTFSFALAVMLGSPAFSQKTVGFTTLGNPTRLGQIFSSPNTATNKIYVTDTTAPGVVTALDGSTRSILSTVTVGSGRSQIIADSATNRIYAFSGQDQTIYVIDGSTDQVIATIPPVATDNCLWGIAVDSAANKLAVLDGCSKSIYVLDAATFELLSTISMPLTFVVAAQVNPTTHLLYVLDDIDHEFVVADLTANTSTTVNLSTLWPQSVAIDTSLNLIYMADNVLSSIYEFDGATNNLINTIKPPTDPFSVAVNQKTHQIVASDGFQTMYFYHLHTFALDGQFNFQNPQRILGFSVNSATDHYYAGAFPTNVLAFIVGPK